MQTQGQFFHMLWVKCLLQEPTIKKPSCIQPINPKIPQRKGSQRVPKNEKIFCILSTYKSSQSLFQLGFFTEENNYGKIHQYYLYFLGEELVWNRCAWNCGNNGSFGFQHNLWSKFGASRSLQCKQYLQQTSDLLTGTSH